MLPSGMQRLLESTQVSTASGIVFLNHPSWWDPLVGVLLASRFFAEHTHYVPMDAKMLEHYGFFRRLGFYGVTLGSRGAKEFLTRSLEILSRPQSMIWLTPQGRFVDVRERPLQVKRGIGHIMSQAKASFVLPIAVEYAFWNHRLPEILLHVGDVRWLPDDGMASESACCEYAAQSLEKAQDELADAAIRRNEADFDPLMEGRTGTGGVYGWWERIRPGGHSRKQTTENTTSMENHS